MKVHGPTIVNDDPAGDDLGASAVLEGLDYSAYYISYRLYRATPIAVPATLLFPESTPARRLAQARGRTRIDPAALRLSLIKGNHTNCITQHPDSLAAKMNAALAGGSE